MYDSEIVDEFALVDTLGKLIVFTGTATDALWPYFVEIDGEELLKARIKQKMLLARYARQSLFEWENREVNELRRYFEALTEVIKDENAMQRMREE